MFPSALPAYDYNGAQFLGRSVQIEISIKYRLFDYDLAVYIYINSEMTDSTAYGNVQWSIENSYSS